MKMRRIWAMPNKNTFQITPIGEFVKSYLANSNVSIDPFARDNTWSTHTNDLNPNTQAQHNLYALDFLLKMKTDGVEADLIIFDPPCSLRQAKECYESFGEWKFSDTQSVGNWTSEKNICYDLLGVGGYFLHFGWHSNGMGKRRNMKIEDVLLVPHGGAHNDTICIAERKTSHQLSIFSGV